MRALWGVSALAVVSVATTAIVCAFPGSRERGPAPLAESGAEHARVIEALRPPKRSHPVIAVLAHNDGTETTDFMVPYGVLHASGVADVVAVAPRDAPVQLMPALRVRPQITTAGFDARYPEGADYVVVPAMHRSDDPEILAWLQAQFGSGATVVGVCDGAWVLAAAGLLDGRAATSHWFSTRRLRRSFPHVVWTADRRYIVDRRVVTTTGVSASIPVSLVLVEAISGREHAAALAGSLGVARWDAGHASDAFILDRRTVLTAAANLLSVWGYQTVAIPLRDHVDDVTLALTADAYARTYRTSVRSVSDGPGEIVTRQGLTVIADATRPPDDPTAMVSVSATGGSAIDAALDGVGQRYGEPTAAFVALQLEYER
jgi:transcriptional regulator GlxA family with amidase domain